MDRKENETHEAAKRKYAAMFAAMERYRHSLKEIGADLRPADVEAIETEVREQIRRKGVKAQASGEARIREIEEIIERKGRPILGEIVQKGRGLTDYTQRELDQVLKAYRETARKHGITVDNLFANVVRGFWTFLSEPTKNRLRTAGYDGAKVKPPTFSDKTSKKSGRKRGPRSTKKRARKQG